MPGEGVGVAACRIWDLGVEGAVVVAIDLRRVTCTQGAGVY